MLSSINSGRWRVGGLILGEDLQISISVKLQRYHLAGARCPCLARRWQSANISPTSVVVTQHILDLITPQYQRDTAANMSQFPSGVMQRNRLLWCWAGCDGSNHSQPRYNCFPAKTFRHGPAHPDEDNSDRADQLEGISTSLLYQHLNTKLRTWWIFILDI